MFQKICYDSYFCQYTILWRSILATHKSAEKRARQSEKRQLVRNSIKGQVRSQEKEFLSLVEKKDFKKSEKMLPNLLALIDRTRSKGVFHINKAARRKSQFIKRLKQAQAQK